MRVVGIRVLLVVLAMLLVSPVLAADKAKKKKPRKRPAPGAQLFQVSKKIKLDDKQKEALAALRKEYAPRVKEAFAKIGAVMTPERRKAAAAALKKARDEGKKGKELRKARLEALKLSEEDVKQLKSAQAELAKLRKEIQGKIRGLLTDEQKEQIKSKRKPRKKPAKKKAEK